jgi:hypothetical protein
MLDIMKRTIIILTAVFCVVSASAQNAERARGVETKKGYSILPAAGDFAIGIDATPMLGYAAGLFSGGSAPAFGFDGKIYGKYFLEDNRAIRFGLSLDVDSELKRFKVADDAAIQANPLDINASTFDTRNIANSSFGLFGGYEWRRGYGRLQGFWGGEAGFSIFNAKTTYEYGNPMTDINSSPSTVTNWDNGTSGNYSSRLLEHKGSNGFSAGLNGFAGIEYFFARKMSIGGEVGLGVNYSNSGQKTNRTQSYNSATNTVEEITTREVNGGNRVWEIGGNYYGSIFMMFHF